MGAIILMKNTVRLFICMLIAISAAVQCFAEGISIQSSTSVLSYPLDMNFENIKLGRAPENGRVYRGLMNAAVAEEAGNRFLRLLQPEDGESVYELNIPKDMDGTFILRFDLRIKGSTYKQIPTLKGYRAADRQMTELVRGVYTTSYSINGSGSYGFDGNAAEKWHSIVMQIDCDSDRSYTVIDGTAAGWNTMLDDAVSFSIIRFLIRGAGEYIDVDNIKVYRGTIEGISQTNDMAEEDEAEFVLPKRRERVAAHALVYRNSAPIIIDGVLSEADWNGRFESIGKTVLGTAKSTANFAVMHDDNGLYIGVRVFDSVLNSESPDQPWLQDGIEVYFDGGNEHSGTYDENDRQYSIGLNTNAIYNANLQTANLCEGVEFAQSLTEDGWVLEMYVPYSAFNDNTFDGTYHAGDVIGFDVGYNDCYSQSGVRDAQIMWNGTANNSKTAVSFGELEIMDGMRTENRADSDMILSCAAALRINSEKAIINGMVKAIDSENSIAPMLVGDFTYIPVRFLAEAFEINVDYDNAVNTVTLRKDGMTVVAQENVGAIIVNGTETGIPAAPLTQNNRLMMPLRSFLELFGLNVAWHDEGLILVGSDTISDELAKNIKEKI